MFNRRVFGIPLPVILAGAVIGLVITVLVLLLIINNAGDIFDFIFDRNDRVSEEVILCRDSDGCSILQPFIYSALLLAVVVTGFAYATLLERKLVAWFQNRVGPNRVGPGGFLQPAADGIKLVFKEDITPAQADKAVWYIAPLIKVLPTLVVLAVIPLGPDITIPWFNGSWYRVPMGLIDPDVGILWILAITSIGTYGVALAGWASSNKYSMLGALRASAQMISYELSMGLAIAVPVLIAGSMSLGDIMNAQNDPPLLGWFVFQNPLAAAILLIALIAETNRAPFDLPEAEQELTAGYMTEYSGMKFALFMMAEYLGMIAVSLIAAATFFGGYHFFLVDQVPLLGPLFMILKVLLFLCGFVWIRATLPRIRYDRLMNFGWKVMLPLALLSVTWTAVAVVVGDAFGSTGYAIISAVLFALVALAGLYFLMRGEGAEDEDDYENDPVITGDRGGIGFALLQVVGGLLSVPFMLFDFNVKALDGLASMGKDPNEPPPPAGEDADKLPAKTSGGD
jgi:NADH-quinone oxidoreductase subunit H